MQRVVWREYLRRAESLLTLGETTQVVAPGPWRGEPSLVVVTSSRLLLIRRKIEGSAHREATFPLRSLGVLHVDAWAPEEVRLRVSVGRDLEEFTVTAHAGQLEHTLRASGR